MNPTKDMIIKRSHKHVDASGMVSLPYLNSWTYPRSNLVDLARDLGSMFGQDPPLYTKPSGQMSGQTNASDRQGLESASLPLPSRPFGLPVRDSPRRHQSPRNSPRVQSSNISAQTSDPQEVFRRNAIASLVDRLKLDITELQSMREAGMDSLVNTQSQLKQRKEVLKQGIDQLREEKEYLEKQVQTILCNTELIQKWVDSHPKRKIEFNIDDVFEPSDSLSKQMLECTSQDLALEDLLYSLDKAVQEGLVPLDIYLKQVRSISREQFFHRAISEKIQVAQYRVEIAHMASRYAS